jgi:serine/threonine-protein kinase
MLAKARFRALGLTAMTTTSDELEPGTIFGRYRIERKMGEGGTAAVYEATHMGLGKRVVVKILLRRHAKDSTLRKRFLREGEAAVRIRHPHVVDVTDVGMHDGTAFLVMEYLEGETLAGVLDREGALTVDVAVDLILPVMAGVSAAHGAGIIHRDIKPDNIFLSRAPSGEIVPKVLDFGVSPITTGREGASLTGTEAMLGTPLYMAPEQVQSPKDVDALSDQYALGVVLYECVTGKKAFDAENLYLIVKNVCEHRFEDPREAQPDLPEAIGSVIVQAMAQHPMARFDSVRHFARALLPFASARARAIWAPLLATDTGSVPAPPVLGRKNTASHRVAPRADTLTSAPREVALAAAARPVPPQVMPWVVFAVATISLLSVTGAIIGWRMGRREAAATATTSTVITAVPSAPAPTVITPPVAVTVPPRVAAPRVVDAGVRTRVGAPARAAPRAVATPSRASPASRVRIRLNVFGRGDGGASP